MAKCGKRAFYLLFDYDESLLYVLCVCIVNIFYIKSEFCFKEQGDI